MLVVCSHDLMYARFRECLDGVLSACMAIALLVQQLQDGPCRRVDWRTQLTRTVGMHKSVRRARRCCRSACSGAPGLPS